MKSNIKKMIFGAAVLIFLSGCEKGISGNGDNPFLQDQNVNGKEDTLYMNPDGIEVEVDLEADVDAPSYRVLEAPAHLGQFALTYMRKHKEFYIESLAEDSSSKNRVEWLVDGNWITASEAESVTESKLKHFRIKGVDAVLLNEAKEGAKQGKVFKAKVPMKPFSVMTDAGDKCADPEDGHITLDQSVYWYMWDPDKSECKIDMQDMSITISKMLPSGKITYPEYDQLVKDGKVTAVILFGQIGDGAISESDIGMTGFREMAEWLKDAKFTEAENAPVGRRFSKKIGETDFEIDLYSPKDFSGLSDYSHLNNFKKAISEHEIVVYDGHSMLGASDFWAEPEYPKFYQIFIYGGCLGYEYYVKPILKGKAGWDKLDLVSSVVEVSVGANEFAGPFLAKMAWALNHEYNVSWKDMLLAIRKRVGDSTFGASGVRENCFSPGGSICETGDVTPEKTKKYEDKTPVEIPDNSETGIVRVIDIADDITAKSVKLDLDISHTFVGDLKITLEHDGIEALIWDQAGNTKDDIKQSFILKKFEGKNISGRWTLLVTDLGADDTGTLNKWSLVISLP